MGAYPAVGLKAVRTARDDCKELLNQGIDPSVDKQEAKTRQAVAIENELGVCACMVDGFGWWEKIPLMPKKFGT